MGLEKLQKYYFGFYEWGKKATIRRYLRKRTEKLLENKKILTKAEQKALVDFWAPYVKIDSLDHAFYKEKTGVFSPEFLSQDLYFNTVDAYFNNREASWWLDNKCLYPRLLPGVPQADSIAFRMGGFWFDAHWQMRTEAEITALVSKEPAVFVKAAARSECGNGVQFVNDSRQPMPEAFAEALTKQPGDIVVQRPIHQHATFAALHESSVNTLRILTWLGEDGVKIYSTIVRMGVDGSKIDNAAATGLFCGVGNDGQLSRYAYRMDGSRCDKHPTSGVVFAGYRLAGVDKAQEMVRKAAPLLPLFRQASWDIVIDEHGDPLFLEVNMAKGSLHYHQLANGPLFGDDTKKIMDEVFGKAKK